MLSSPTTNVASPMATIAGGSNARFPVISATININPSGAWATLPSQARVPDRRNNRAEASDHADHHERRRRGRHARRHVVQHAPQPQPDETTDDHAGTEDAA